MISMIRIQIFTNFKKQSWDIDGKFNFEHTYMMECVHTATKCCPCLNFKEIRGLCFTLLPWGMSYSQRANPIWVVRTSCIVYLETWTFQLYVPVFPDIYAFSWLLILHSVLWLAVVSVVAHHWRPHFPILILIYASHPFHTLPFSNISSALISNLCPGIRVNFPVKCMKIFISTRNADCTTKKMKIFT